MGEAKRRGSFDDRKAQSLARQKEADDRRKAAAVARREHDLQMARARAELLGRIHRKDVVVVDDHGQTPRLVEARLYADTARMFEKNIPIIVVDPDRIKK